jgi:hypothetical protein
VAGSLDQPHTTRIRQPRDLQLTSSGRTSDDGTWPRKGAADQRRKVPTAQPAGSESPPVHVGLSIQCVCTGLVALGAAYASYRHGREFALQFGTDGVTASIWPLLVDGLLTIAIIGL